MVWGVLFHNLWLLVLGLAVLIFGLFYFGWDFHSGVSGRYIDKAKLPIVETDRVDANKLESGM